MYRTQCCGENFGFYVKEEQILNSEVAYNLDEEFKTVTLAEGPK